MLSIEKELNLLGIDYDIENNWVKVIDQDLDEIPSFLYNINYSLDLSLNNIRKIPEKFVQNGTLILSLNKINNADCVLSKGSKYPVHLDGNSIDRVSAINNDSIVVLNDNLIHEIPKETRCHYLDLSNNKIENIVDMRCFYVSLENNPIKKILNTNKYMTKFNLTNTNINNIGKNKIYYVIFQDKKFVVHNREDHDIELYNRSNIPYVIIEENNLSNSLI